MIGPTWTPTQLQQCLEATKKQIDEAEMTKRIYEAHGSKAYHLYKDAKRKLPELRKLETMLVERIREEGGSSDG